MTRSEPELEDRIRRVLDQAARQLPVRPVAWRQPPPSARPRLSRPNVGTVAALAAVLVALVIAGGALIVLGNQHHTPTPSPGGSPHPPPVPMTLNGDGLARAPFGVSPHRLERLLVPLLGKPEHGYQKINNCGIDHELSWPVLLDPTTGRVKRAASIQLYFTNWRFVGYQFGSYPRRARTPHHASPISAHTARGLALGDTLAVGRRLYGPAFTISPAQGGTWTARTASGPISGYALGESKHDVPSPQSRIATIDAGHVGCPALSP